MLQELSVSNLVIVRKACIQPGAGLTVITGETGAGKSLLLDALGLILGDRARGDLVGPHGDSATVSAVVSVDVARRNRLAEAVGLDIEDDDIILRRKIGKNGRSNCWINDAPVGVKALKLISEQLVEIRAQHAHLRLGNTDVQLGLLDRFGGHRDLAADYSSAFRHWRQCMEDLVAIEAGERDSIREREFLQFQLEELNAFNPQPGELAQCEQRQGLLAAAQDWQQLSAEVESELSDGDNAIMSRLGRLQRRLEDAPDEGLAAVAQALLAAQESLREASSEASSALDRITGDPAALAEVEERLAGLLDLIRKHGGDEAALHASWEQASDRLAELDGLDDRCQQLRVEIEQAALKRDKMGNKLCKARRKAAKRLVQMVAQELTDLGMPKAELQLFEAEQEEPTLHGTVQQQLFVRTNPGLPPGPLNAVPSGGEAARLTLALAVALADADDVPVLVFDEVDSGVGGRLGAIIADKLQQLSNNRSVIVISHTPQLAAKAATHYRVGKSQSDTDTTVSVHEIAQGERQNEIADMLGGGAAALNQARALLGE